MAIAKPRGRPRKVVESIIPAQDTFNLTLTVGEKVYTSSAPTIVEAIQTLPTPQKITLKSTLLIVHGNLRRSMNLSVPQVKRLFYPLAQKVLAKQLAFGLK